MVEPNEPSRDRAADTTDWPYASLLLFGFFGTNTETGRRLVRRTTVCLVLAAVSVLGLERSGSPFDLAWAAGLPMAVGGIGWAYARYLGNLDELARMIQLRAFAVSYGAVMFLAFSMISILHLKPALADARHPASFLAALVMAELFRGLALVVLARRYR